MNPLIAAQQIAQAAQVRAVAAGLPRLAYSSVTGDTPRVEVTVTGRPVVLQGDEAHCFVCGRHTDHFAEHDELVEAGLAQYDRFSGSVLRTEAWDADRAREIADAAFNAWLLEAAL